MASIPYLPEYETRETYLNSKYSIASWLLTKDHKRIAVLYMISITLMFAVGGTAAVIMRLQLLTPHSSLVEAETYNKLFTLHGIVMVFFFLVPSIPATLGNFLVPLMIGARDLAFPRINLFSWYLYIIGASLALTALIHGGVDTGWTFYTPYSSTFSNTHVVASDLRHLHRRVQLHPHRTQFHRHDSQDALPGHDWFRLPLFIWSMYATSIIFVLATPVLAITLALVALERILGVGIFDPNLGGDPILFQHMFWFYSHPAVYIMILPGMGVISELIPASPANTSSVTSSSPWPASRSPFSDFSSGLITCSSPAFPSMAGWSSPCSASSSPFPRGSKSSTGPPRFTKAPSPLDTPMLYALGFIGLFTIGGLTGLFLATLGIDMHVHDTYFVIAHFHYIMVGGAVMAYMGGLHFWWPKMTGKLYPEWWGRIAAVILFLGFNLTFFPQFLLGYLGMPRRYYAYAPEFQVYNVMSTAGASILAIGYLLPLGYLLWSLRRGKDRRPQSLQCRGSGMADRFAAPAR